MAALNKPCFGRQPCDVLFRLSGASAAFDLSLESFSLVRMEVPMQAKDGKGGASVRTITAK
jgi:hypothetical protein